MIDDKIFDELREYLKDNYIPSNNSSVNAISITRGISGTSSIIGITGQADVLKNFYQA